LREPIEPATRPEPVDNKASPAGWPDLFYPIVPDGAWLARVLDHGVRTVQLRIKDSTAADTDRQVAEAIRLAGRYGAQLIINDFWRPAIEHGASDLHLGQEDLAAADLEAIRNAGIRLGISTHTPAERDIAMAARPDLIALGPIYETKLKVMRYAPQGLERISEWKQGIAGLPLVAIGGLTPERADRVIDAGADSVAVITDFYTHHDPDARLSEWMAWRRRTIRRLEDRHVAANR